jgi:hypothetical protein
MAEVTRAMSGLQSATTGRACLLSRVSIISSEARGDIFGAISSSVTSTKSGEGHGSAAIMSLEWAGYQRLRPGRIHLFCKGCKRKLSNLPRQEGDPTRAELVQTWCPKCQEGCKDVPEYFLDRRGKLIEWDEIEREQKASR